MATFGLVGTHHDVAYCHLHQDSGKNSQKHKLISWQLSHCNVFSFLGLWAEFLFFPSYICSFFYANEWKHLKIQPTDYSGVLFDLSWWIIVIKWLVFGWWFSFAIMSVVISFEIQLAFFWVVYPELFHLEQYSIFLSSSKEIKVVKVISSRFDCFNASAWNETVKRPC